MIKQQIIFQHPLYRMQLIVIKNSYIEKTPLKNRKTDLKSQNQIFFRSSTQTTRVTNERSFLLGLLREQPTEHIVIMLTHHTMTK